MRKKIQEEEDEVVREADFDEKVNQLDFDIWGEEEDGSGRRRDPLRRSPVTKKEEPAE